MPTLRPLLPLVLLACGSTSSSSSAPASPSAEPSPAEATQAEATQAEATQAEATQAEATPAEVRLHQHAPAFEAPDQDGELRSLASMRGKVVVLYFYPRDATPGCTTEACAFRDTWSRFEEAGALVVGVSTDDVASHAAFAEEHDLPFPLLADPEATIAAAYEVPVRANYAARMTFLIDREGILRRVFEEVDPGVHADEVLAAIDEL